MPLMLIFVKTFHFLRNFFFEEFYINVLSNFKGTGHAIAERNSELKQIEIYYVCSRIRQW